MRYGRPADRPGSLHIEVHRAVPNLFSHVLYRAAFPDAGVADEKVDPAESICRGVDQSLSTFRLRNICLNCQRADTCSFRFTYRVVGGAIVRDIVNDHISAKRSKATHGGTADSTRTASND